MSRDSDLDFLAPPVDPIYSGPKGLFDARGRFVRFTRHALLRTIQRCHCKDYADASAFLVDQWKRRDTLPDVIEGDKVSVDWFCWWAPDCKFISAPMGLENRIITILTLDMVPLPHNY